MKISDVDGKMRVCLRPDIYMRYEPYYWMRREVGTLTSGRILRQRPGYEEGLSVRVKWDGFPTPERNHVLTDFDLNRTLPLHNSDAGYAPERALDLLHDMRDLAEDILWTVVDWIDLHLTALKLGVSAGWLKDRQASARAFLAQYEDRQ